MQFFYYLKRFLRVLQSIACISKHFRSIETFSLSHIFFDFHLIDFWCALDKCKIFISKNVFSAKSAFSIFFILHRFYSKFILVYSRFCTSSISNLVTHRNSLLKKKNIVTIRTCLYLNFSSQVHFNFSTFNVHSNYSKFIFIWIIRISFSSELLES